MIDMSSYLKKNGVYALNNYGIRIIYMLPSRLYVVDNWVPVVYHWAVNGLFKLLEPTSGIL